MNRAEQKKKDAAKRRAEKQNRIEANNARWAAGQAQREAAARKSLEKHRHLVRFCGNQGCPTCNPCAANLGWRHR